MAAVYCVLDLRKKGFAYGRIGEHDKAKDCFDRAVLIYEQIIPFDKAIDTDFAYALNSKGYYLITYSPEKYHKEAIECFDRAINIFHIHITTKVLF